MLEKCHKTEGVNTVALREQTENRTSPSDGDGSIKLLYCKLTEDFVCLSQQKR